MGKAAQSSYQANLVPRTARADHVTKSICPYCAVGCGQRIYAKDGEVTQIEGDPDSAISRGRLCPKGAASRDFIRSPIREYKVKYRRPYSKEWEELPLEEAIDMIADRLLKTRHETWEDKTEVDGGALILAGAACERWSVFKAGFQSARDPKYTVMPQRERLRERDGARNGQTDA